MIDYDKVPVEYMRDSVRRYIEEGIMSGHFLTALFSNNLVEVFNRADTANGEAMEKWVAFLFCYAPRGCWGSKERVEDWIKDGGLVGQESDKVTELSE